MAALPYMPLYVADYLADAAHLTTLGHGAYLLLIMTYWQRGEALPDDDRKLARIARLTDGEWSEIRDDIAEFFTAEDGRWRHGRIERELDNVRTKSEKASGAGKASAESRRNKRPTSVQQSSNERSADAEHSLNHTDTDTDTEIETSSLRSDVCASAQKKSADPPKRTPRQELETVLSPELAGAVIEHRSKLRKSLTLLAAEGLAKGFLATGDPDAAARMMVERGWQGFKPEWFFRDIGDERSSRGSRISARPSVHDAADALVRWVNEGSGSETEAGRGTGQASLRLLSTG